MATARRLPPVHPGEILRKELMAPLGLSITKLSGELRMPVRRVRAIVNGRRSITADTALRLASYFAMTPQFWMNLQIAYDLDVATRASADIIRRDVHPRGAVQARVDCREATLGSRRRTTSCSVVGPSCLPL